MIGRFYISTCISLALSAALVSPAAAVGPDSTTSLHPEEAIPDPGGDVPQGGQFADFNKRVQERLRQLGFDAGPVNGYFGEKTQAALAQFQLANNLPVSGSVDEATLDALGIAPASTKTN